MSDQDGNTLCQNSLKQEPTEIRFFPGKPGDRAAEHTVSANLAGRTLYLFTLSNPDNPIELAFQKVHFLFSLPWRHSLPPLAHFGGPRVRRSMAPL